MDKLKILLIEDNHDVAYSLATCLELAGHQVRIAYSGLEGVRSFLDFGPHIVISDIYMPDIDGYCVAKSISALAINKPLLIALSGYPSTFFKEEDAAVALFDHFLLKPPNITQLKKILLDYGASRTL